MSIKITIHFKAALTNVVIKDVSSGEKIELLSVAQGDKTDFEPDDYGGEATVDVAGKKSGSPVHGRKNLRHGDTYDFPPDASSVLDEISQFGDLGELARGIEKLLKK